MEFMRFIKKVFSKIRQLGGRNNRDLQPKDILDRILAEIEKKKKLGIEDSAFVPNVYVVFLSPTDYEELSPLLAGLRDQLKNRLMEKIRKNGYRILASSISIELRQDGSIQKNQVVVESAFVKERITAPQVSEARVHALPIKEEKEIKREVPQRDIQTKIIEEKKTRIIEIPKVNFEIVEGVSKGEIISLKEGEYTFGRGREASILIKDIDETVSRLHFRVVFKQDSLKISDLSSCNGTKVNNLLIESAELKKGDTITAGKVLLKVA